MYFWFFERSHKARADKNIFISGFRLEHILIFSNKKKAFFDRQFVKKYPTKKGFKQPKHRRRKKNNDALY